MDREGWEGRGVMGEEEMGGKGDERGGAQGHEPGLYRDYHRTTNRNTRVKPSSLRFTLGLPRSSGPHPVFA